MRRRTGIIGTAAVLGTVAVASLRRTLTRYAITDRSMSPALRSGDYVVARRRRGLPDRGDVVVFRHPDGFAVDLVKRVVGLPGERIDVGGGAVAVDGRVLAEPWADGPTFPDGSWTLGYDEVFVLGDRRAESAHDSRMIGPVPLDAIAWQVTFRYHPVRTAGPVH